MTLTSPRSTGTDGGRVRETGAHALTDAMDDQGIDTVFGTVGHGNLTLIDALLDSPITFISAFHEQVAIHAADAYYRVSGRVAVVVTTVGPGATNLATGLGDALLDCSGVVVITGGVPTAYAGKDALQSLSSHADDSQSEIFRPLTKRVIRVTRAEDLVPQFHRAVQEARQGRPGPVLLHVPLDLFADPVTPPARLTAPTAVSRPHPDPARIDEAATLLAAAGKPVLYCGGGANSGEAPQAIATFAGRLGIPVVTSMSGQGAFPEDHPLALGTTGVVGTVPGNTAIREADLIIAVGTQFPEMDSSSWRPEYFAQIPPTQLIHIDAEPQVLNRVFRADVAICSDARAAIAALDRATAHLTADRVEAWRNRTSEWTADWRQELTHVNADAQLPLEPAYLLRELRSFLPDEAILVSGVGIRHAVAQHFPILRPRSLVVGSGFGTMGQETAAALGVAAARPGVPAVALVGDGAVLACLAAIPTAVAAALPVRWILLDNGGYASIAVYQDKHFGRLNGTRFVDPKGADYAIDYLALARSFGAWSARVSAVEELRPRFEEMMEQDGPALLSVPVTATPRVQGSGHWDVNDILAAGARLARANSGR